MAESPLVPGLFWAGTDDGNIQVSRDGGATWKEVSRNLPGGTTRYYVSRVEASYFDPGTAYVSIDGHKSDDLRPYVYVTRDYGESWVEITSNLPEYGNVNTVRQDPHNPTLLYAGTEFGVFVSLDEGAEWHRFMPGLPVVRIDDLVVHPRDNDLVLATHGRSIWIMDDVTALQSLKDEVLESDVHLFEPRDAVLWKEDIRQDREVPGNKNWRGDNAPPGTAIQYYLGSEPDGEVSIRISDPISGEVVRDLEGTAWTGLNRVQWDLSKNPEEPEEGEEPEDEGPPAGPGVYRVTLAVDAVERSTLVTVHDDVWLVVP